MTVDSSYWTRFSYNPKVAKQFTNDFQKEMNDNFTVYDATNKDSEGWSDCFRKNYPERGNALKIQA